MCIGMSAPARFTWGVTEILSKPFSDAKPVIGEYVVGTALLGGKWNNGSNAGAWYWNVNNSAANVNRNIGTHLLYERRLTMIETGRTRPASWQNTRQGHRCRVGRISRSRRLGAPHIKEAA